MTEPLILVVTLWVNPEREQEFIAYEHEAARVMAKHGGRIERAVRLAPESPPHTSPFEIHIVSFPSNEAFERYRADAETERLSKLRSEIISRTTVLRGRDVPGYGV